MTLALAGQACDTRGMRASLGMVLALAACGDAGLGRAQNPEGPVTLGDATGPDRPATRPAAARGETARFRNTYYDFPTEERGPAKDRTVYDASCKAIADVPRAFHDHVCLQGSGRLADGSTISFAKRDCGCAEACPKSGQRICFERLDPKAFPWGRGALGRAITPLKTVAVDPSRVPMGAAVFVREYVGAPGLDGRPHDGCFVAEDRGSKVEGAHLDVFTGSPTKTKEWNALVPSNDGVTVEVCSARCPLTPACAKR